MHRQIKREILATLIKRGRRDLARLVCGAAPFEAVDKAVDAAEKEAGRLETEYKRLSKIRNPWSMKDDESALDQLLKEKAIDATLVKQYRDLREQYRAIPDEDGRKKQAALNKVKKARNRADNSYWDHVGPMQKRADALGKAARKAKKKGDVSGLVQLGVMTEQKGKEATRQSEQMRGGDIVMTTLQAIRKEMERLDKAAIKNEKAGKDTMRQEHKYARLGEMFDIFSGAYEDDAYWLVYYKILPKAKAAEFDAAYEQYRQKKGPKGKFPGTKPRGPPMLKQYREEREARLIKESQQRREQREQRQQRKQRRGL